jgi:hypothetical protein
MNKIGGTNWQGNEDWHVPEDDLLPFVDGEQPAKVEAKIRKHLEACWTCRRKVEKVQQTISAYVEYYTEAYVDHVEPPPHGWSNFETSLRRVVAEAGVRPALSDGFPARFGNLFSLPVIARAAAGLTVAALGLVAIFLLFRSPRVSASELVQKAAEARNQRVAQVIHPLVYQKLRLQADASNAGALTWEIWNDEKNSHTSQRLEDSAGRPLSLRGIENVSNESNLTPGVAVSWTRDALRSHSPAASSLPSLPPVLRDLQRVSKANRMDWRSPLSPANYASWRNSLSAASEEVRETRLADGERAYKLTTTAAGPLVVDAIAKSELTVRSIDWHPVEQYLEFEGEGGMRNLDLKELSFDVLSLDTYRLPSITEELCPVRPPVAPVVEPLVLPPVPPSEIELMEAETQARYALHRMGACTGEPVQVSREPSGGVIVSGLVETGERKEELETALRNIALVEVKIQTPEEALATNSALASPSAESTQPEESPPLPIDLTPAGKADKTPIEPQLRAYFDRQGSTSPLSGQRSETTLAETDEAITILGNQSVSLSGAALMEVWALRRLAEAYPREKADQLSPRGKLLLETMLTEHLAAYKLHARQYVALMQPVLSSITGESTELAAEDKSRELDLDGSGDSAWNTAILHLFATTLEVRRLTTYFFAGASCPETRANPIQELVDDADRIEVELHNSQERVAGSFSGHFDLARQPQP